MEMLVHFLLTVFCTVCEAFEELISDSLLVHLESSTNICIVKCQWYMSLGQANCAFPALECHVELPWLAQAWDNHCVIVI